MNRNYNQHPSDNQSSRSKPEERRLPPEEREDPPTAKRPRTSDTMMKHMHQTSVNDSLAAHVNHGVEMLEQRAARTEIPLMRDVVSPSSLWDTIMHQRRQAQIIADFTQLDFLQRQVERELKLREVATAAAAAAAAARHLVLPPTYGIFSVGMTAPELTPYGGSFPSFIPPGGSILPPGAFVPPRRLSIVPGTADMPQDFSWLSPMPSPLTSSFQTSSLTSNPFRTRPNSDCQLAGEACSSFMDDIGLHAYPATDVPPKELPVPIALPEDRRKLSPRQVFLRLQIEYFAATEQDVTTHARGRNKGIKLGQVGIRCRHCAHLPMLFRQKGSAYFPATLSGLYQAGQNMSTIHLQSGLCEHTPLAVKRQFIALMSTRGMGLGVGSPYWAQAAAKLGLVDTEVGIRFVPVDPSEEDSSSKSAKIDVTIK